MFMMVNTVFYDGEHYVYYGQHYVYDGQHYVLDGQHCIYDGQHWGYDDDHYFIMVNTTNVLICAVKTQFEFCLSSLHICFCIVLQLN